ncbi:MAG: hypothetical protein WA789_18345 [Candidatus Acidiferrum sp.]
MADVSNSSKVLFRLGECITENILKNFTRDGCIPESFVGNYAVDYEPGAHVPAMTLRSLQVPDPPGGGLAKVQR